MLLPEAFLAKILKMREILFLMTISNAKFAPRKPASNLKVINVEADFHANEPDLQGCPENACYTRKNRTCEVDHSCYKFTCNDAKVDFQFKSDFLLRNPKQFIREGIKPETLFSVQTDDGWVNNCKNSSFEAIDGEFDFRFSTEQQNLCHHLKRHVSDDGVRLSGQFVLSGTNKVPGTPIKLGRRIKFDFTCPLDSKVGSTASKSRKSNIDEIKRSKTQQQFLFVGAIFLIMLTFVCIHLRIQKRHREEMSMLKNKVF